LTAVNQSQSHSTKKGITVGAFGRFIGSVGFIGIMLWLPLIASLPIGIFLHALGLSVIKPIENVGYSSSDDVDNGGGGDGGSVDIIRIGLVAFGLVMAQGVIVGIIFEIITAKIKKLHITNRRKGVSLGLATGVIAWLVLYVSVTVYPSLLTNALAKYPQTIPFTLQGLHTHAIKTQSQNSYLSILLGYGLFAYLIYGFILGGILVWATSLYRFNISKAAELEKYR
jgi:hypothetical protein